MEFNTKHDPARCLMNLLVLFMIIRIPFLSRFLSHAIMLFSRHISRLLPI